jgi:hypothetical protein
LNRSGEQAINAACVHMQPGFQRNIGKRFYLPGFRGKIKFRGGIGVLESKKLKEYFKLQLIMINRKLSDFAGHPVIGWFLSLLAFIGLSEFLFYKTASAPYAYILIVLYVTSRLSEIRRNDFLKICFGNTRYRIIRILENMITISPFVCFLFYKQRFYPIIILTAISVLTASLNFKTTHSITIPTPFYKKPFEFTAGFRNVFYLFFIPYGLAVIASTVDNFSLGIFSLLLIFFIILCFYIEPENEYFVWIYSLTPSKFLMEKIRTAFLFSFYLCLPVLFTLSIFYFENIGIILLFMLLGYLYITMIIMVKYAAWPKEMNIVHKLILLGVFIFPPMLVALIPFFIHQSVNKLREYLK